MIQKLDKRQKVVLVLLGLVLIVLVWQAYGLLKGESPATPATPPAAPVAANSAQQMAQTLAAANTAATPTGAAALNPAVSSSQTEYLRLVNEYQMAQLQRMIAEDNEAIAVAKRNAAQALSDTMKLAGSSTVLNSGSSDSQAPDTYALIYTGQQADGQWAATLKKNGQVYDVIVGKQLADGFRVASVDENSVLLKGDAGKLLVTFAGQTKINSAPTDQPATQSAAANPAPTTVAKIEPPKPQPEVKPVVAKVDPPKPQSQPNTVVAKIDPPKPQPVTKPVVAKIDPPKPEAKPTTTAALTNQLLPQQLQEKKIVSNDTLVQQLLQVDPKRYTIQLSTAHQQDNIKKFIENHELGDKAAYFPTTSDNGRVWYVLIYGSYATHGEAEKALEELPAEVTDDGAFLISYANVHGMLKQAPSVVAVK